MCFHWCSSFLWTVILYIFANCEVISMASSSAIKVMVNGMPGPMALETARVCVNRGYELVATGFTGPKGAGYIDVVGDQNTVRVTLAEGPGVGANAGELLKDLKEHYENLIIVDYTHPSAVLSNVKCYVDNKCDFVMGTTGEDPNKIAEIFRGGENYAVIAPNMAKQIVAMQAALLEMSRRFPESFQSYRLEAVVSSINQLTGQEFSYDNIVKLRKKPDQLDFGVPVMALNGHAFHTYTLTSADGSTTFELKHNVCGRRIYAEGTADAVEYLDRVRAAKPSKRLYDMIDVLESGIMK